MSTIIKPRPALMWSPQQDQALAAVRAWQRDGGRPFFYLDGYAGTGKSTLAAEIASRTKGETVFGAYTGKAAAVMRAKGCEGADTIDALIYRPLLQVSCADEPPCDEPPCSGRCRFYREKFVGRELNLDSDVATARLAIVDEVSMVNELMGRDLLSFGTPVLVLGDTAQLPPIYGGGFFTAREPDFQLTEVHRQALGSPVIKSATRTRQGLPLRYGDYGLSAVVDDIDIADMLDFDQIICGTHRTRHRLNRKIRRQLGFRGSTPEVGEKVICLKNDRKKNLRNGTLWTVIEATELVAGFIEMRVRGDGGGMIDVVAPTEGFASYAGDGSDLLEQPFAFGYVITCHKAQGSQWNSVLAIDESRVFHADRHRWLYTAITRAVEQVVVVM